MKLFAFFHIAAEEPGLRQPAHQRVADQKEHARLAEADRQGVELKVLDQLYAETGQIGFRGSVRTDGKGILASEGIKVLTMAAST